MRTHWMFCAAVLATVTVLSGCQPQYDDGAERATAREPNTVLYRTADIEGLEIFYREAGSRENPTILLLHGFPTSSHMFRDLMPALADAYHVIAPDYPGFPKNQEAQRVFFGPVHRGTAPAARPRPCGNITARQAQY